MGKVSKSVSLFIASMTFLLVGSCGGGTGGSVGANEAKIPECGFSMELPSGWVTEKYCVNEYYKRGDRGNCWGMAKFCPMSGRMAIQAGKFISRKFKSVSEFAKYLIKEDRFEGALEKVISEKPMKIGEVQADAYGIIYKAKVDGHIAYVFDIYIEMENRELLQVYFQVSEKSYQNFRTQYANVVKSIHLTKKKAEW